MKQFNLRGFIVLLFAYCIQEYKSELILLKLFCVDLKAAIITYPLYPNMEGGIAATVAMLSAPLHPAINICFKRLWTHEAESAAEFKDPLDQMNGLLGVCGKLSRVIDLSNLQSPHSAYQYHWPMLPVFECDVGDERHYTRTDEWRETRCS